LLALALGLLLVSSCVERKVVAEGQAQEGDAEGDAHHATEAATAMASHHQHLGPHFKWTAPRPQTPEDLERAEKIVQTLRTALARYKDHRVARADGFQPFLPNLPQPRYHFTSKWYALKGAFRFNPAEPTSLLYQRTPDGFELIGAMYTAPKRMGEEQLNQRVPLSVARWHVHVNICLPPRSEARRADLTRFGFKGSITTEEDCTRAGGRFYPQMFGWMLHVYPFEETFEKIWSH
jgi:hypothetical protein